MGKMSRKEKVFYAVIGILLTVAISSIMSVRAQSRNAEALLFDNRNYEAAEAEYKQQVQQVLESYDCYNSGLTMTRVVSLDGERQYRIQIHNKKIEKMDSAVYESMRDDIASHVVSLPGEIQYPVEVVFE